MQQYYDLVEDLDDNRAEPSETDKKILEFLTKQSYETLSKHMSDDGESYTELKAWSEQELGLPAHDGLFLGYAIQAIVDDSFSKLPLIKQSWMRKHPYTDEEMADC